MDLLKRFASSRVAKLLVVAGGSWRFWAASAVAATTVAVATVVAYTIVTDSSADGKYAYQRLVTKVSSSTSNPNPSPRILLMNSDRSTACFVDCESFTGASSSSKTARDWWEFVEDPDEPAVPTAEPFATFSNLQPGNHFRLRAKCSSKTSNDGAVLWDAFYCRGGNLNKATVSYVNQLPFSKKAQRYNNRGQPQKTTQTISATYAGTLIMQNTTEAKLVSSCYDEGIGTIYFDAVNGFNGYTSGQLQVQVAFGVFRTNVVDGSVSSVAKGCKDYYKTPDELRNLSIKEIGEFLELEKEEDGNEIAGQFVAPDAAHADEVVVDSVNDTVTTNAYGRCAWITVNLSGAYFQNDAGTNVGTNSVASLQCTKGGTNTHFYRFWAPVQDPVMNPLLFKQCNGPMRFRIVRLDNPNNVVKDMGLDGESLGTMMIAKNGLLILDNIIASYPAMRATAMPHGEYVSGGSSRNAIGWRGATSVAFPTLADTATLTATAGFELATNAPPDTTVTSAWVADVKASMKYRWRYLVQTNEWQSLSLEPADGAFASTDALQLPGEPGDVEFYYETQFDAPYYKYLDYSGTGKGTPGYSERITRIESRLDESVIPGEGLPSTGKDFFFRLRDGASEQLEYRLEFRPAGAAASALYTNAVPCYVVSDGTWKSFVSVTTNKNLAVSATETNNTSFLAGDYEFRVVGVDPNAIYGATAAVTNVPWSAKRLVRRDTSGEDGWQGITLDAATGAFMFQLMEGADAGAEPDELTFTVVHADYQNFNTWHDAVSESVYVGAFSEEKGRQSGTSPDTREYASEIGSWTETASANDVYWKESFALNSQEITENGYDGHAAYESFTESRTPNGWRASSGQWVSGKYRESKAGGDLALLLDGSGAGVLSYVNSTRMPYGVDTFRAKVRVAQSLAFDDFAYYMGESLMGMKDYAFAARALMATSDSAQNFEGNGSISLVAYYRPNVGCYEVRAERVADDKVRISLYKWAYDADGSTVRATFLGRHRGESGIKYKTGTRLRANSLCQTESDEKKAYVGELFIACRTLADDKTEILVGVMGEDKGASTSVTSAKHYLLKYTDADNAYKFGTFGVGSANCPAQIFSAKKYALTASLCDSVTDKAYQLQRDVDVTNGVTCASGKTVTYPSAFTEMFQGSSDDPDRYIDWATKLSRFKKGSFAAEKSLVAVPPTGQLALYLDDTLAGTYDLSGFTYDTNCAFVVRSAQSALPRLKTGAKSGDVVVDDVSFTQWCAADYDDSDNDCFQDWRPVYGCPLHYVYMNGWVNAASASSEKSVTLAPARVRTGEIASIRAPLMDGLNDGDGKRGIGLGVLSFTYRDADSNCVVRVQYRELSGASGLSAATASAGGWTDAAVYDFSEMTDEERAGGTLSTYVGQHGKAGVMRLVIDPAVVTAAKDEKTNPGLDPRYGAIEITDLLSRDEPAIDDRCWWGWNLRTTDAAAERMLFDGVPSKVGLALALNNSTTDGIDAETADLYSQRLPFVQTPTFATNTVGQIDFRARRLPGEKGATEVAVFGAKSGQVTEESQWKLLQVVVVSNDTYRTFSYRTSPGDDYAAFRLAVIGVEGVDPNYDGQVAVDGVRRVLIDEVSVCEAIRGMVAFRDVGAFRTGLSSTTALDDVPSRAQQPLVNEVWGVQAEVYVAQMEEEIDTSRGFEVTLHWFEGEEPWGYANWRDRADAKHATLARVTDRTASWVYRSSYEKCPDAVIGPMTKGGAVQYMLEVQYYTKGSDVPATNTLSSTEWTVPEWYHPIDLNAGEASFSAYTILDSIAPGWAWINEVNVFGSGSSNSDASRQYVEVAMPAEADLEGWSLRFLDVSPNTEAVVTNTVAVFGSDLGTGRIPSTKTVNMGSNCVFMVVACPAARTYGTLDASKGEVDGYWTFDNASDVMQKTPNGDYLFEIYPVGMQLVRPSGIVEHELVMVGTNAWTEGVYASEFNPDTRVAILNRQESGGQFFFAGYELGGEDNSLGTLASSEANSNAWTCAMARTPGSINVGQVIDPNHPTPSGDSVVIYLNVGAHVWQTLADGTKTNITRIATVRKGDADGYEVVYDVDRWYALGRVTTNAAPAEATATGTPRRHRLVVAQNCSNSMVTVQADSVVDPTLVEKFGLTDDNRYRDAVMDWLSGGKDLDGHAWQDDADGEIHLARYMSMDGALTTNMTLTSMYWLDIPATESGWVLRGGIGAPSEVTTAGTDAQGNAVVNTNIRMQVYLAISNENETATWATSEPHRLAHAPYVLRSVNPGKTSRDADEASSWTSTTFKVTSFLVNGKNDFGNRESHIPLRWFVFGPDSFNPRGHTTDGKPDEFWATIDAPHPYSPRSPAWSGGDYYDWVSKHGTGTSLFYRWDIDDRRRPDVIETLKADSTLP